MSLPASSELPTIDRDLYSSPWHLRERSWTPHHRASAVVVHQWTYSEKRVTKSEAIYSCSLFFCLIHNRFGAMIYRVSFRIKIIWVQSVPGDICYTMCMERNFTQIVLNPNWKRWQLALHCHLRPVLPVVLGLNHEAQLRGSITHQPTKFQQIGLYETALLIIQQFFAHFSRGGGEAPTSQSWMNRTTPNLERT